MEAPTVDEFAPPLTTAETRAAAAEKIAFPIVIRTPNDSPIHGQRYGLVSFHIFEQPRSFSDGTPMYGYMKLRGNWADESQAKFEAGKIIKEVDSVYEIKIAPVGSWVPITNQTEFTKEHIQVHIENDKQSMLVKAMEDKEKENRRIRKEIEDRSEQLKSGDVYDDPTSIEYYTMKRITEFKLMETRDSEFKKLEKIKENIDKTRVELIELETKYPEYMDQWEDCYNIKRSEAGIENAIFEKEYIDEHYKFVTSQIE